MKSGAEGTALKLELTLVGISAAGWLFLATDLFLLRCFFECLADGWSWVNWGAKGGAVSDTEFGATFGANDGVLAEVIEGIGACPGAAEDVELAV